MQISSTESFLSRIVSNKRDEIIRAEKNLSFASLQRLAQAQSAPRDFRQALAVGENIAVIAEMKKASPSAGVLREDFDPVALAKSHVAHGAAALSVLTDEKFFGGNLENLQKARAVCALPILRKDFILNPYQILEARAFGADAILLIVAMLDRSQLFELLSAAEENGLQALVEVHNEAELDRALLVGANLIGINNRNLQTFEVRLETTERLSQLIPPSCVRVAESGIACRDDVKRMAACGVDAILVGSHLMRQPDPGAALSKLTGVARR
ncbi:MAG: indole-3-glycerol phosphate synthase TrpC [candidate division KSB1 bacterium]|nr:indole-3-glycerol phosphate synthase TrpC [candidate division KSB1 bacterium]MDZ7366359.1 indole-3-glycerol phosphate synthase TrpC [candidate division KSB1 bacterium]MDZ7404014.1 indole-3-glycerol phosphate synthase TrpC [candidate division KSB1 bacterium]